MQVAYLAPAWFFGYDVALEVFFGLITLLVCLFAFRAFKTTKERQIKLFGISFLFFCISYFLQAIFNFLIILEIKEATSEALEIQAISWFNVLGIYAHMLFMLVGLVLLVYMSFKTEKKRVFWLALVISLLAIAMSVNPAYMFFLLSTIYALFLVIHFVGNYLEHRQSGSLIIALAFIFIFLGSAHFLVSMSNQLFYALGHVLNLVAYLLILLNFYLVWKT